MSWPTPSLRRRSKQVARRPQTRPAVEIVEDRTLLTAYIVDNAGDSGTGTLRDIIQRLNSDPSSSNTIDFQFDPDVPTTIALLTPLDAIIKPVVLNSTNRTDVTIDGGGGGFDAITLGIGSDGSTVQSLNIRNFAGAGVVVQSANDQVAGNIIGGVTTGVRVTGAGAINAQIEGNRIGVDAGNAAIPVTIGVLVNQAGTFAVAGNTIGNALTAGVQILNATAGGSVTSNFVGMTSSGTAGNGDGVQIFQSSNVTVGGADPDATNYIGNSSGSGVVIAGASATGNFVLGNVIGFTAGSPALPAPNNYGVSINGSAGNTIGANQIDASLLSAVHLFNTPATGNAVAANLIGVQGTTPAAKNAIGIEIISGQDNTIGGANAGDGNTIVRAATAGVVISGTSSGNKFQGNFIGTDASLSTGLGNAFGVLILGGSNNVIGGTTPNSGEGNTIGGNTSAGVSIAAGVKTFVYQNLYIGANGPAFPAGDINVAATANGGIQPPVIGLATLSTTIPGQVDVTFPLGVVGSYVEIYAVTGTSRTYLIGQALGPGLKISFPQGSLKKGDILAATVSSTATTEANTNPPIAQWAGTSAFSNPRPIADDLTVITDEINNLPGSLYYAINYANSLHGGTITFALGTTNNVIKIGTGTLLPIITGPITFDTSNSSPVTIQADGPGIFDGFVLGPGSGGAAIGNGTNISNLTFRGFQGAAIRVQTSYNSITGVTLDSNKSGIEVLGSNNMITGGTYTSNVTGVTLAGAANSLINPTFTGAGTAVRASGSNQIINGGSYTGTSTDTAIIVDGVGSTITGGIFKTYATGIRVTGTGVNITGSEFRTRGTAIYLAGNLNHVLDARFTNDPAGTTPGNILGVLIQGSSNTVRDSRFESYSNSGIQVATGNSNEFSGNTFTLNNRTAVDVATAIVVGPGANEGVVPPAQFYTTLSGKQLTLNFTIPQDAAPLFDPATIEIYQWLGNQLVLSQATLDGGGHSVTRKLSAGFNSIPVILEGAPADGTEFLILLTTTNHSTSAFSSSSAPNPPNVVFTTSDNPEDGSGSLRSVMKYVMGPGAISNEIYFNIPSSERVDGYWTIYLSSPLPTVVKPIIINGWRTPGTNVDPATGSIVPLIRIMPNHDSEKGSVWASGNAAALAFKYDAKASEVRGLNFTGFTGPAILVNATEVKIVGNQFRGTLDSTGTKLLGTGVLITGGIDSQVGGYLPTGSPHSVPAAVDRTGNDFGGLEAGIVIDGPNTYRNTVAYNNIGADGSTSFGNTDGIRIQDSSNNLIRMNLIGGNLGTGVIIASSAYGSASRNRIEGNYVGTGSNGRNFGNATGVRITGRGSSGNLVGGVREGSPSADLANDFGWNATAVQIDGGASGNWLRNNFIGTSRSGIAIPNTTGVAISGADSNYIGPDPASAAWSLAANLLVGANFISGNLGNGVVIDKGSRHNTIRGNLIGAGQVGAYFFSGNDRNGVLIDGSATSNAVGGTSTNPSPSLTVGVANLIIGNYIGVVVLGAPETVVGGNQISQNLLNGVAVEAGPTNAAVRVLGNIIGMQFDGSGGATTGNGTSGIVVKASSRSTLTLSIHGNLISHNGLDGIQVTTADVIGNNKPKPAIANVRIDGNIIGLDAWGDSNANLNGNVRDGVYIQNVGGVQVGIETPRRRSNVISGNLGRGVGVYWTVPTSTLEDGYKTTIVNNAIGSDTRGIVDSAHAPGNLGDGVWMFGGGETDVLNNLIAGNRGAGIHAFGGPGSANKMTIASNLIVGKDQGDRYVGNGSDGIFLDSIRADGGANQADDPGAKLNPVQIVSNFIGANRANGIQILQSSYITIAGNRIGDIGQIFAPKVSTPAEDGNGSNGIFLNGSSRITVGAADAYNVISGNRGDGVVISDNLDDKLGNFISGNLIGLSNDGQVAVGNHNSGVVVSFSSYNEIGTAAPNVISGNRLYGVVVVGLQEGNDPQEKAKSARHNTLWGNRIGTNSDGSIARPNSSDGVFLLNAQSTTVGGDGDARNIISGNSGQGVRVFGPGASGNKILKNYIGLNSAGNARIANSGNGVIMDQATGGPNIVSGNTISGNAQSGLLITSTTNDPQSVVVTGNFIGTDKDGVAAVGNSGYGISLFGVSNARIGGAGQGLGNVISGNNLDGVLIYTPSNNAPADGNVLLGNFIGTNATGTAAVSNQGSGVHIINSSNNQIGGQAGSTAGWNVISGNRSSGILVEALNTGEATPAASANVIAGNLIGTDSSGTQSITVLDQNKNPVKAQQFGVLLSNALNTVIGRTIAADAIGGTAVPVAGQAGNVISGNGQSGVYLTGNTEYTQVVGNYLGVDAFGLAYDASGAARDLRSAQAAVLIDGNARFNLIGGLPKDGNEAVPGTGNIITQGGVAPPGADTIGVMINSPFATGNVIASNLIGLDASGRSGGNTVGVLLSNAQGATIGGAERTGWTAGTGPYSSFGNVISGNANAGVEIAGPLAANDRIYGNFIGTDITGNAQPAPRTGTASTPPYPPSQVNGVLIYQGSGHQVGAIGARNLISGNMVGVSIAALQPGAAEPSDNVVEANFIGTDATGMKAVPNYEFGVLITASGRNTIRGNLLSANGVAGVEILGGRSQSGGGTGTSLGNTITGNLIGTDAAGQVAFAVTDGTRQISPISQHPAITLPDGLVINYGFQNNGVVVIGASDNLVTGGNTISGNIQVGVYITRIDNLNNTYGVPTGNVVQGNNLGLNGIYGVFRYDAPNGNPADANTFTGTPIPIGDFVTGLNPTTPSNPATSILLGGQRPASSTPSRPRTATPPRRARPALPSRPQLAQAARLQGTR